MTDFSERVVIVTGAASGMGDVTAHTFALAGAQVVLLDRDADRLPAVVEAITAEGGRAQGHIVNLCEEEQVRSVLASVVENYGRIDVVDNNAAALELSALDPELSGLDGHVLVDIFKADVLPGFLMTKYVLPTMLSQGSGSIINIASVTGMSGELWLTGYGMAKAAVIQMTRATAAQYSKQGIRCNAISPAYVTTPNNEIYVPPHLDFYLVAVRGRTCRAWFGVMHAAACRCVTEPAASTILSLTRVQDHQEPRASCSRIRRLCCSACPQVTDARGPDGTLEVWRSPITRRAACPDCGRSRPAVIHGAARPRDVLRADRVRCGGSVPLECDEDACCRKTFTEWLPQVPPRCRITARLRSAGPSQHRGITPAERPARRDLLPVHTRRSPPPWPGAGAGPAPVRTWHR